jgi:6-phosphogluconolactonase (cycloisomerase 2 family)
MKFRKFGKALLMSAVSAGLVLGVTSCVQSFTVGFLFVTGTSTAGNGSGIISAFKIDHNTGNLKRVNGTPVASKGAFPGRAVLAVGSRFVYVLNRGTDPATNGPCTAATVNCTAPNISEFAVGGTGVLSFQASFFTQGNNPFRLVTDAQNNYLYVLDAVAPSGTGCAAALGPTVTSCGDITAFKIDQSTGRLSLVVNAQVTSATGSPLPYFPVPADPIDMALTSSFVFTLSGTPATGDVVFPYAFNSATGQLTVTQNSAQPINATQGTAIATANGIIYVLDDEPITIPSGDSRNFPPGVYLSQLLPFTAGTGGALQAQTGGAVPDDPNQSNPIVLTAAGGSAAAKWVYLANQGPNTSGTVAQSGVVGYRIDPSSKQLIPMSGSPFSMGSGPQCLLEDPSNQFFYTANFNDSTVTGRTLDANSGVLNGLKGKAGAQSFKLDGPAAWCLVSGRTS